MPTLEVSDQQVLDLVRTLPLERQDRLLRSLLLQQWPEWQANQRIGEERIRLVAQQRGHNWDEMAEDERLSFVDDLVHEDRPCMKS